MAIEFRVGGDDSIGTVTAVDLVRFAVSRIERIAARTSVEDVSTRTPVKDVIALITKHGGIANEVVSAAATYQAVV